MAAFAFCCPPVTPSGPLGRLSRPVTPLPSGGLVGPMGLILSGRVVVAVALSAAFRQRGGAAKATVAPPSRRRLDGGGWVTLYPTAVGLVGVKPSDASAIRPVPWSGPASACGRAGVARPAQVLNKCSRQGSVLALAQTAWHKARPLDIGHKSVPQAGGGAWHRVVKADMRAMAKRADAVIRRAATVHLHPNPPVVVVPPLRGHSGGQAMRCIGRRLSRFRGQFGRATRAAGFWC